MAAREHKTRDTNHNKNEESSKSNRFFLGAILGGMVGAVAALFLTPKSGKELRNTLNNQTGTLADKTIRLRENVVDKGYEFLSLTSSLSKNFVQQSTDLLDKAKGKAIPNDENEEETEIKYIPIHTPEQTTGSSVDGSDVRKKLEEAKKAFEEEENRAKP